ncbi:translational activator for mitochondrial COX1 [Dimargaris verticillata]|uniref:Translational activator for mitochondrial COX1 n=1 Tax=Dimargaris verticillata TaxID=2761393 RepID=A0A9W8E5A6_9FUNG|nr:translational activator for mitochondrial COX1 [Dimargaris verticillata]
MKIMIETQCPIFVTAYNDGDLAADLKAVEADYGSDIDWLLRPGENIFKSEKKEVNLLDLTDRSKVNWHLYGIRGKRYELAFNEDDEA